VQTISVEAIATLAGAGWLKIRFGAEAQI